MSSLRHSSPALAIWAIGWLVAAAMVVVTGVGATEDPVAKSIHASGERLATLDSVTAELKEIHVSPLETKVRVSVAGRESSGDATELAGPAQWRLDDGTLLLERRGWSDGRDLWVVFDPVPTQHVPQALILPGLALVRTETPVDDPGRYDAIGSFTLATAGLALSAVPARAQRLSVASAFGRGELVIDEVIASGDELLVKGKIDGFSRDAIYTDLMFETLSLTFPDGSLSTYESLRIGFDENPGLFELRFNGVGHNSGAAELRISAASAQGDASTAIMIEVP